MSNSVANAVANVFENAVFGVRVGSGTLTKSGESGDGGDGSLTSIVKRPDMQPILLFIQDVHMVIIFHLSQRLQTSSEMLKERCVNESVVV